MKRFFFIICGILLVYRASFAEQLIIQCPNNSAGIATCQLPANHGLTPIKDCKELKNDPLANNRIVYITEEYLNKCGKELEKLTSETKCPNVENIWFHRNNSFITADLILYCVTNTDIRAEYDKKASDSWSYAHKQCVGSGGKWKNGVCNCNGVKGATRNGNECICDNPKQKYYNYTGSGCLTLENGVKSARNGVPMYELYGDLSWRDRSNSCGVSGGTWQEKDNSCVCNKSVLHMELDPSGYFCNCEEGYDYRNPLYKSDGCISIDKIDYTAQDVDNSGNDDTDTDTDEDNESNTEQTLSESGIDSDTLGDLFQNDSDNKDTTKSDTSEKLNKAEEAYKNAKNKEQSLANRTLTAATTAATGMGMMTAAAARAEQKADEDAEKDMAAYLATFRCEYGKGQSAKASNEEITLPGGNDLLSYYTEYKSLADKLKVTKKALGLRPGIEEEVLYDRAQSGLYQYASVGKTDGAYTSLARALTDENGKDAAEWKSQKEETAKKLKTGLIATGAGVVGGLVGNIAINGGDDTAGTDLTGLFDKASNKTDTSDETDEGDDETAGQDEQDKKTDDKTHKQTNNKYGIDLSKDGINNFGYNLSGSCTSFAGEETTFLENDRCTKYLTKKGTWWTSFDYGIVYGDSKCGTAKEIPNDKNAEAAGLRPCFCKATAIDDKSIGRTDWVYLTALNSDEHCQDTCATTCSAYLSFFEKRREKMLAPFLQK